MTDNVRGILLAFFGIVLLSPDSLLIRLIGLDLWTLGFLRAAFVAAALLLLNVMVNRRAAFAHYRCFDRYAWGAMATMVISTLGFVAAVQTTSVAHTLIMLGTVPIITAILAWVFLGERISGRTAAIIGLVVVCLVMVVYDDTNSTLAGDVYALVTAVAFSVTFIMARRTRLPNLLAPFSVSGALMALVCLPMAALHDVSLGQVGLSGLLGALVAGAYFLLMLAPRFISPAEVAVFAPLETLIGTCLAWWVLNEYPGDWSVAGGVGVMAALLAHSVLQVRGQRSRPGGGVAPVVAVTTKTTNTNDARGAG